MEGNLHRARSTLESRPSSSMSSFTTTRNNEPSSIYASANYSAKHRQTGSLDDSKANHSRGFSDASNTDRSPKEDGLGISNGDGADTGRPWFWNGLSRTTSLAQRERPNALEPLHEDGPAPEKFHRQRLVIPEAEDEDIAEDQGFDELQKAAGPFADFDSANPPVPSSGLTRARSTTQMRDIRYQMQDLKGKISTLKQRARQDSLYRRSLQNLRTPSPFTAAEQWYTGVPLHRERTASVSPQPNGTPQVDSPAQISPQESDEELTAGRVQADEGEGDHDSGVDLHEQERPETALLTKTSVGHTAAIQEDNVNEKLLDHDATSSDKSLPELPSPDAEEAASFNEVEDSLNGDEDQYHDTSTLPIGERHEDRPDAFDYEHFFLHSGMGHHKTGASRSSSRTSSYSSVETTKPTESDADATPNNSKPHTAAATTTKGTHTRKESIESTTSFTTALSSEEQRSPIVREGAEEDNSDRVKAEETPRNVVIAPIRSDSLKHLKANRAATTQKPRDKRSHKHGGIRPPSNSLSSAHPTIIAQQQQQRQQHQEVARKDDATNTTTTTTLHSASSSPLLGYLATVSPKLKPSTSNHHHQHRTHQTHPANPSPPPIRLTDRDAELTERLFQSLAKVCADLEALEESESSDANSASPVTGAGDGGGGGGGQDVGREEEGGKDGDSKKYKARMYRRQLDAARRVLDGEVNGEAF